MVSNGKGAIAVISSVQGKIGVPFRSSYAASKHAVQGYFDCLRAEVTSKGITVTIISPGYVQTDLSLNAFNGDGSRYGKMDATTQNGMNPDYLAEAVANAIANGETDIIVADAKTNAAILMKCMFPGFLANIMEKRARSPGS